MSLPVPPRDFTASAASFVATSIAAGLPRFRGTSAEASSGVWVTTLPDSAWLDSLGTLAVASPPEPSALAGEVEL